MYRLQAFSFRIRADSASSGRLSAYSLAYRSASAPRISASVCVGHATEAPAPDEQPAFDRALLWRCGESAGGGVGCSSRRPGLLVGLPNCGLSLRTESRLTRSLSGKAPT